MPWGLIMGSSWASGLSLYGTIALLGIAGRLGWTESPEVLRSWPVLALALVLFAVEFLADKVPFIDSAWDSIHTVIRPLGAAWLAAVLAGQQLDVSTVSAAGKTGAALVGAALALSAHSAKATTRLAINTSPEPVSNIGMSLFEDGIVVAMVALAWSHPRIAGVVAVVLAVLSIVVIWKLFGFFRQLVRRAAKPNVPRSQRTT